MKKTVAALFLVLGLAAQAYGQTYTWEAQPGYAVSIQNQLNALKAQLPPGPSAGSAGDFLAVNSAGNGLVYTALYGDVVSSSSSPGKTTVDGIQGIPVSNTAPTTGASLIYNGTEYVPSTGGGSSTFNIITPALFNGTDTIGCFNGARCGETNVADEGTVGQNSWGLETASFTSNGTNQITVASIASTHFAVNQHIALYGAALAPTATSTPALTVTPTTWGSSYTDVDGIYTTLSSTCTVGNALGFGNSGQPVLILSYSAYEAGNTITIEGNNYTVQSVNLLTPAVTLTTNLLTQVTGRNVSDGVSNASTTLTSATASFTSADVGRPVVVQANGVIISAANTTIATITNGTTVVLNNATTASATGANVSLGPEPITGANCSTSRSYEAAFVYSNGFIGPLSSCTTSTTSANAENVYNTDQVQGNWDSNAIAVVIYGKEGASCSGATMLGFEIPSEVYNAQGYTSTNAYLNDTWLIAPFTPKIVPTQFTYHNVGMPYGQDFFYGKTPPAATGYGILQATITAISGTFVTLNTTVSTSVTGTMGHDDGPSRTAAIAAARHTPATENIFYNGLYTPTGQYPLAETTTIPYGSGFHEYGDGGRCLGGTGGFGNGLGSGTRYVWRGPLGGVVEPLYQTPYPEIDHLCFDDTGGTTPGVYYDLDTPNSGELEITGQGHIHDFAAGVANTVIRSANTNTGNIEFFQIDNFNAGLGGINPGEKGFDNLSGNALAYTISRGALYGEIGAAVITGHGFDNVDFPQPGSIAVLAGSYFGTPFAMTNSREEHLSRWIYSPVFAGGGSTQNMTLSGNTVGDSQFTPDCGFIVNGSSGPMTMLTNFMDGVFDAAGTYGVANSSCLSGFVVQQDPNGMYNYLGNTWDEVPQPYSKLDLDTNHLFTHDQYRNNSGIFTTILNAPIPTATVLTLSSVCSPAQTINKTFSSEQVYSCSVATGSTLSIPWDITGSNTLMGFIDILNNQLDCRYYLNVLGNGSSGVVELVDGSYQVANSGDVPCTVTNGTANNLNVDYNAGTDSVRIQNNGPAGTSMEVGIVNGPHW